MVGTAELDQLSRDLRRDGLLATGLYHDAQVDDARFVLEVLKSARRDGASAVSHAAVVGFEHHANGRLSGARIKDQLSGKTYNVRAKLIVNATGPGVDQIRGLDRQLESQELRPAKGVHVVLRRDRLHADAAVACQAADGRNMFLCPYHDVHLIGTTDTFTGEDDWRNVSWEEVDYLLEAVNRTFPNANLDREDVVSVYAGVRPLVAKPGENKPPSSVSREHRITEDPSGLISVAGGKLTTFRAMAEELVNRAVGQLPSTRRNQLKSCRTANTALRIDNFDRSRLESQLADTYGLGGPQCARLVEAWGSDAVELLRDCPALWRDSIGGSRYIYAEIAWAIQYECATNLCDILEHRMRIAALCPGQGLDEIERIGQLAGQVAGWPADRIDREVQAYREQVRTRYQVCE
jgi:glycerol-3-phosphate dehydrogenase